MFDLYRRLYRASRPVGIVGPCSSGLQSRFEAAENRPVVPAGATRVTTAAATRRQVTIRWRGGEDVIDQPRKPERVIKSGAVSTSAPINWLRGVQSLRPGLNRQDRARNDVKEAVRTRRWRVLIRQPCQRSD